MIKTNKELVAAAMNAAMNVKSVYGLGCFGWPMTDANKTRALNAYAFNRKPDRQAAIQAADKDTSASDCIGFVKSLLWGWCGDMSKQYGGAAYQSNGVPDIDEAAMLKVCKDVSEDFSNIMVGEYLYADGHCGIYAGNGVAVESTWRWDDGVQETAVYNITGDIGGKGRYWKKHGKLPYITYEAEDTPKVEDKPKSEETAKGDYTLSFRYLRRGCKGEDVKALQILLIGMGYDCGGTGADGDFGAKTEAAVIAYQKANGLAADGIVGEKTMGSLMGV